MSPIIKPHQHPRKPPVLTNLMSYLPVVDTPEALEKSTEADPKQPVQP